MGGWGVKYIFFPKLLYSSIFFFSLRLRCQSNFYWSHITLIGFIFIEGQVDVDVGICLKEFIVFDKKCEKIKK